jgi:Bacterial PH domain
MSHDDFAFEPKRGLPGVLPPGERLLWQGTPNWHALAVRSYQVRKIAAYFALLVLWRVGTGIAGQQSVASLLIGAGFIAVLGAAAIATLAGLAYLNARSAVYSVTTRRVLLRQGIAVPLTLNIPLQYIEAAGLRLFRDGTGDIAMTIAHAQRIAFLINWPHLKPGRFTRPEPSFRALDDAREAARILGGALAAESMPEELPGPAATTHVLTPRPAAAA